MNSASNILSARIPGVASDTGSGPRLLVSVRSVNEARAAIQGGVDIIDVKEPQRGPLGMADSAVITAIAEFVKSTAPDLPVSTALGELSEFDQQVICVGAEAGLGFAKLGLGGVTEWSDWRTRWSMARQKVEYEFRFPFNWVAVAYADSESAGSPSIDEVLSEAVNAGCAGLLIDTFCKSGGGLLDFVDEDQLRAWGNLAHQSGMFIALAGRIAARDLPRLAGISTDVIAVRSAVCPAHQRDAEISGDLVAAFRQELNQMCAPALS